MTTLLPLALAVSVKVMSVRPQLEVLIEDEAKLPTGQGAPGNPQEQGAAPGEVE